MDRSTWLITGASSGLGYALAEYVLQQGDQVVAAARTLEPMAALTERYPDAGLALTLDVTDPQQRADAISQAEARFGAIDILVNNAGIDFIGAIEEQEEKDYRAQFEVNFFAAAALLRQVLPGMRARGRGTIINISSMDGIASLPGQRLVRVKQVRGRRPHRGLVARTRTDRPTRVPGRTRLLPHRPRDAHQVLRHDDR
jgi:NADP-dependent 3-hydroxy acid dehydrogenase YdfG